jgi:hypothetical protein
VHIDRDANSEDLEQIGRISLRRLPCYNIEPEILVAAQFDPPPHHPVYLTIFFRSFLWTMALPMCVRGTQQHGRVAIENKK